MKHKGMLDKTESTKISWKDGCNPCIKKQKKKGKKGKKLNVEVKQESFFNIFSNINPENEDENEKKEKNEDEDGEGSDPEDDSYQ